MVQNQYSFENRSNIKSVSQHTLHNIQLQISYMFKDRQAMFADIKVRDWFKEHSENLVGMIY
jgi:hypothetical protein